MAVHIYEYITRAAREMKSATAAKVAEIVAGGTLWALRVTGQVQARDGLMALLIGADSAQTTVTDATSKRARVGAPHYLSSEEAVALLVAALEGGTSELAIGGGAGNLNAVTTLRIYTAANNTTLTGTLRVSVTPAGNVLIGSSTTDDGTHRLQVTGAVKATSFVATDADFRVAGTKVVGARVVNAALAYAPNTGDANTDALLVALRDLVLAHGLGSST